ncbi:MAG TPA: RNA polymerase Rpb6 [Flavobacteriales bacterium]|nr:RNA polymerase Rpb6 [Flavobacteriales bacterium]HIA10817.1 RNA polymerase Rpb6 [Flavobacteriales bacterium]HIO71662.1 RNA polymerase Rpb6 [Flavobacteriales bacterium]
MDYKKTDAEVTTITRDLEKIEAGTDNIYKSIVVVARRANQIGSEIKEELDEKLAEFATTVDNLEEIFENREQIEISKFYERLPKPSLIAINEIENKKIYIRTPEVETDTDTDSDTETDTTEGTTR